LPRNFIRAVHAAYPVSVTVPPSKGHVINRAPWGLGANFVEFLPGSGGTLTLSFDGADGFAWRAFAVATAGNGRSSVLPISLDAGAAGSITISGLGNRWSRVTLVPTIADRPGAEVPFAYAATLQ
ncbi:MAG: hypothetical protein ACREME_04125, partial [Gemmatimonadales bacterium]